MSSGTALPAPASRNAPCPCGSGRRYKDCHGVIAAAPSGASTDSAARAHQLAIQGLAAQERKDLAAAKLLYEQALALAPDHADALHMLGVVHFDLGDAATAVSLIMRALDLTQWQIPTVRQNFGLALAKLASAGRETGFGLSDKGRAYWEQHALAATAEWKAAMDEAAPLVSVVVPSYNHARYVSAALESVYTQSYRHIELIVIDDGSSDGSQEVLQQTLQRCPFPHQLLLRENRGAHATLNEAVALSRGHYVNPLNSDDLFAPSRIEMLLRAAQRHQAALVFSNLDWIDSNANLIDPFADARVYALRCKQAASTHHETVGHALISHNIAATTGNLFFARTLFDALSGFRAHRYNHDWDFCLRALWITEPVHIQQPLYRYRFHGSNTIAESTQKNHEEAVRILGEYLTRAFDPLQSGAEFTPNVMRWQERFVSHVLGHGLAVALPPDVFKNYALSLLEGGA